VKEQLVNISRLSGRNPATAWQTVGQVVIEEWAVNKKPRTVGYSIWKSHGVETSGSSLETAPEDIRRAQLASEVALAPLAKWFQDLRKMKFQPSNSSHTACSID
jgi:hypothetical protein